MLPAFFSGAEAAAPHLGSTTEQMAVLVPRLLAAVALATALSLRPWRVLLARPLPKTEMVQAQILLCAAAAVITAVIGDSVAKAFGLVGLGGFVRFRSGLKDPRDAAILFLVIGLGMACGHGSLGLAAAGTGFVAALLLVLDLVGGREKPLVEERERLLVSVASEDVNAAENALRQACGQRNVLIRRCAMDFTGQRLELEVEEGEPGGLSRALEAIRGVPLRDVRWAAVSNKGLREERS